MKKNIAVGVFLLIVSHLSWAQDVETPEPMALQGIMKKMGQNMGVIAEEISKENWKTIEGVALEIAEHPTPPFSEKIKIMAFAGSNITYFKEYDAITHKTATRLAETARMGQGDEVIELFSELQKSCLACHQMFRESFKTHFY